MQLFKSLKDASYQSCINKEKDASVASYVLDQCPSFLDNPSDEVIGEIKAGHLLRYSEIREPKFYTAEFVPCSADTKGAMKYDIHIAMSYSQQQYGRMKNEDPKLHAVIGDIRSDFSTYSSNRMSDLKRSVKKLLDERNGVKRNRSATKDFAVWLSELADTIKDRAKTAKARGDDTVNDAQVTAVVKAMKK